MHKLILNGCAFVLMAVCHPANANSILLVTNAALAGTDAQTTYTLKRELGGKFYEKNPAGRPFVSLPKPANLSLAIAGDVLLADIGLRMRRSHRWYRHIWWLPQVAVAGGNAWGITNNERLSGRIQHLPPVFRP